MKRLLDWLEKWASRRALNRAQEDLWDLLGAVPQPAGVIHVPIKGGVVSLNTGFIKRQSPGVWVYDPTALEAHIEKEQKASQHFWSGN